MSRTKLSFFNVISIHTKIKTSFIAIFFIGLGIRFFYFPYDLPLTIDGMDNFTYTTAINYYGYLPNEWSPPNNGWPIFLSFWFSIINLNDTTQYMQLQRVISVILSSLTIIPVYFLCKKFFDEKISLFGAVLFAFDPRIILNSLLGITEPMFILLGISSLIIFLRYNSRSIVLSFILASFCTIVRSEGIFLFFTLTILFFIRYRFSKEIFKTYLHSLVIFFIILSPIISYRMEVIGYDGIFQRAAYGTSQVLSISNQDENGIVKGLELFIKYLGWIMIPNFLIFLPVGAIQYFRKRIRETNFIIIFLLMSSIPILYAYIVEAQDTRYFYFLYPIFCLVSLFAVRDYLAKFSRKNMILSLMICGILVGSISFYEYKKIDYEKEKELYGIAKIIPKTATGFNFHPAISRYISATELPNEWPFVFFDDKHEIKFIHTNNNNNLEDFIYNSRNELTHLVVDDDPKLPMFLQEVFHNGEDYDYLDKVFDSKDASFKHHVKIFKIDFQKFNFMIKK